MNRIDMQSFIIRPKTKILKKVLKIVTLLGIAAVILISQSGCSSAMRTGRRDQPVSQQQLWRCLIHLISVTHKKASVTLVINPCWAEKHLRGGKATAADEGSPRSTKNQDPISRLKPNKRPSNVIFFPNLLDTLVCLWESLRRSAVSAKTQRLDLEFNLNILDFGPFWVFR